VFNSLQTIHYGLFIPVKEFYQVDYLDCYGDPEFIGKVGAFMARKIQVVWQK